MLDKTNRQGKTRLDLALDRIKLFEPPEGYYLAFSGGKDSIVIKELCDMAGVKYDSHYHITTVDPPELIDFIKKYHSDVERKHSLYDDGSRVTMWNLIRKKRFPPTRRIRYCCKYLKEGNGVGRFVITGVRWAESWSRKTKRAGLEMAESKTRSRMLDPDNPQNSAMARFCPTKSSHILNPIIDWEDEDVWEFIKMRDLPYCSLYDEGFKRIGCIACPMSPKRNEQLERYPKIKKAYIKTFDDMLIEREKAGQDSHWNSGEDVMKWWVDK